MPRSVPHVDEPFAKEIGLEAAGTSIGSDRRLVGQLQGDIDIDVGDAIGPDMNCATLRALMGVGAHIGADVGIAWPRNARMVPSRRQAISMSHSCSRA